MNVTIQSEGHQAATTGAEQDRAKPALTQAFELGNWLVEPRGNRLQCLLVKTSVRSLEPRLMHLLCYLAANQGRVLDRDELIQELWPRVIVNENSLTRAVSELRKQLSSGEKASKSPIETIPKKGYRLTCGVNLTQSGNIVSFDGLEIFDSHWPKFATAAVLVLTTGVWMSQMLVEFDPGLNASVAENRQLADEIVESDTGWFGGELTLSNATESTVSSPGTRAAPVLSGDESKLAYIQYDGSGSTIFVTSIENLPNAVAIYASPDYLHNLSWSPVGNALLFARKKQMTTTALFSGESDVPELMLLDLDTMETSRLHKEDLEEEESSSGTSLTSSSELNTVAYTS